MIFLSILFFWLGYLFLGIFLARKCNAIAKECGWKFKNPGLLIFILMWTLVFWDWLPMEITYRHLCKTEAGFIQRKTIKEWREENPGEWENLSKIDNPEFIGHPPDGYYYEINQRFIKKTEVKKYPFHILKRKQSVLDRKTGEEIATYVDVTRTNPNETLAFLRAWMEKSSCESPEDIRSGSQNRKFSFFVSYIAFKKESEYVFE